MKLIEEFATFLIIEKGLSQQTAAAYQSDVALFAKSYDLLTASQEDAVNYLNFLRENALQPASIKRKITSLSQFYLHLQNLQLRPDNPFLKIKVGKATRKLPVVISESEFLLLLKEAGLDPINGTRNQAILELLLGSALRVSELCDLTVNDINWKEGVLRCRGKGNKERLVPISSHALPLVDRYINFFRPRSNTRFLFLTKNGKRMAREKIYDIIIRCAKSCGLTKKISPHTFRHSAATMLLENGVDLRTVQEYLGHQDITTTQVYTHIGMAHLKKEVKKFHPRMSKEKL